MTSRPNAATRHWSQFLREMILFCEKTLRYTDGLGRGSFLASGAVYDATLWNIALIGEAANRIPAEIQDLEKAIPWRNIIDARNYLIHNYFGIDEDTVWDIIKVDIPSILPHLRTLLESSEQESSASP